ncbi:hypothetical protein HZB74_01780 [Candidatus Saccharibacteria bacterium]|nr:hypothetical protein [Candidatus Saccharibacteria bacterium]
MSDSLSDILSNKDFKQPDEITKIKNFVKTKFGEEPKVSITSNSIVVIVKGAAMAGALRPEIHKLQKELSTNKKLLIRIS